jgi:hypothetical protein
MRLINLREKARDGERKLTVGIAEAIVATAAALAPARVASADHATYRQASISQFSVVRG